VSVGRVSPERAAFRSRPEAKARLSRLSSRGVPASKFVSCRVALGFSSSAPVHLAPRNLLASVLKRLKLGWRIGRGEVIQAQLARIKARVSPPAQSSEQRPMAPVVRVELRQLH
jgi:hypothetical protein